MSNTMNGRTCIVTGANSGIGFATAAALIQQGATVVLACRDEAKGYEALREIESRGGPGKGVVMRLDLASLHGIRNFASDVLVRFPRIDVLVNNAGIMPGTRQITADGFEMIFGVNHLGHYVLTRLFLEAMKASAPSRVVVVASTMHHRGKLDFVDLQSARRYRPMSVYSNSKLANVMFTKALARRLEGSGVTANCLHPGVVRTNIIRKQISDYPRFLQPLGAPVMWMMLSPEAGARTSVYLATSPEANGVTGEYFVRCKRARVSKRAEDRDAQERLWEVSARLAGMEP